LKKHLIFLFSLFLCLIFVITACTNTPAAVTPEIETETPVVTTAPTEENIPTEEPVVTTAPTEENIPTEEPVIPCTITFESNRDGNWEIYRMAPDGSENINLSNNPADDTKPAWSPDGTRIAFVSNRAASEEGSQQIFVMNADGSGVLQLTFTYWSDSPSWSHDGSQITYTGDNDIFVINADGSGEPVNLTNSTEKDVNPVWSPDGSKIAWSTGEDGNWNLFVMDPDGGNKKQITDNGQTFSAVWTIDGRLWTNWGWKDKEEFCQNCVVTADGMEIVDGGGKGTISNFVPFVTADGDRVELAAVDSFEGNPEIYIIGDKLPDTLGIGIGIINLTNNPADDINADWPLKCLAGIEVSPIVSEPTKLEPEHEEFVFGYASYDPNQGSREANFQIACNELGIQCVYGEIRELIDQDVDAIIQNSDNMTVPGLHNDILNARDAGIPVFLLDAESITHGAYSITIDHSKWAKTSFGWLLEKIGGSGEIAYFDLDPFNRYTDVINDLLLRYPGIKVVEFRDGKYDSSKIKPETSDFVFRYPDLKAIWSSYDNNQAMWGLEGNGIPYDQWPVMVCEANLDGLLLWERAKQEYPDFDCFAVANPPGIAYDAVYAAYYLVSGYEIDESVLSGPYGQSLYVDFPEITNDNYKQVLEDIQKMNWYEVDQFMTPDEIKDKWFLE